MGIKSELEKICRVCKQSKLLINFGRNYINSGGLRGDCKSCRKNTDAAYHKIYYSKHKERLKIKGSQNKEAKRKIRLSKYGILPIDYNKLYSNQRGVCKICDNPETIKRQGSICSLVVDHCHKTGKVRGLLCNKCNLIIGKLYDNLDIARNIVSYLEQNI